MIKTSLPQRRGGKISFSPLREIEPELIQAREFKFAQKSSPYCSLKKIRWAMPTFLQLVFDFLALCRDSTEREITR
jgi:hypothetical protein